MVADPDETIVSTCQMPAAPLGIVNAPYHDAVLARHRLLQDVAFRLHTGLGTEAVILNEVHVARMQMVKPAGGTQVPAAVSAADIASTVLLVMSLFDPRGVTRHGDSPFVEIVFCVSDQRAHPKGGYTVRPRGHAAAAELLAPRPKGAPVRNWAPSFAVDCLDPRRVRAGHHRVAPAVCAPAEPVNTLE